MEPVRVQAVHSDAPKSVENTYLDLVKGAHQIESDYKLAALLGVSQSHLSQIRKGKSGIGPALAVKIAEQLGWDPMGVISACQVAQGKTADERSIWEKYAQTLNGLALPLASILLGGFFGLQPAPANAFSGAAVDSSGYTLRPIRRRTGARL